MKKIFVFVIIIGLVITGYGSFQWYQATQSVSNIPQEVTEMSSSMKVHAQEMKEEPELFEEPIMSDELDRHNTGENIANLQIPSIGQDFSVFWGTDDDTLTQGVGMYVSEWTTTPDQFRHTLVSGHRDTVFTKLGDVNEGDEVTLDYEGKTYTYVVKDIWITHAEDRTVIIDKEEPTLTITTCYPFDYIGFAPDRYIIQAELTDT